MRGSLEIKESNNCITSEAGKSVSASNNIEVLKFNNNADAQMELSINGYKQGDNYFVSQFKPCDKDRGAKNERMKKHFGDLIVGKEKCANKSEEMLVEGFKAIKRGEFNNFLANNVINNSADDPVSLGGTAFLMPSLAKMMGESYTMEAKLGTTTTVGGSQQTFTIEDFCKCKTNSTFEYAPEVAYTLQSKPNIFSSYVEIENQITDEPGSQAPLNTLNNYEYQMEVRKVKTHSVSKTLQYNLLQMAQLNGYYGIDQIAQKQDSAMRYFDEIYYYNGMKKLFNNVAFSNEKASKTASTTLDDKSVLVLSGLLNTSTGVIQNDFRTILNATDIQKQKFCSGFRIWKDNRFGNQSMEEAVLVLPLSIFVEWDTTSYFTSGNINNFVGTMTFREYFEKNTGIKVMPLNLIDPIFAGDFGDLFLGDATGDRQDVYFYSKKMFEYITTKSFKQFNTWGTANNCDFTTIYEGEFVNPFCPYYNANLLEQRIPAVKISIYEGAITLSDEDQKVLEEKVEIKKTASKNK